MHECSKAFLLFVAEFALGVGGGTAGEYIQKSIDGQPFDYKKSLIDQTEGYILSLFDITKRKYTYCT